MANAFKAAAKAKAPAAKKKDEKPEFNDPTLDPAIKQWKDAKSRKTQAEQDMAEAETAMLDRVEAERCKASAERGACQSTVIVNGELASSTKNAYSAISPDGLARLQEIFGEKDASRYFRTKMEVAVKESVLADEEQTKKLIEIIGEENVGLFFDVTETTKPTEAFHNDRSVNPEVTAKAAKAIEEGHVRPFKASFRVA